MNTELRKRLEEEKHKYAHMLTPIFSLHYSDEYGRIATAFMRGAELGYKEAIAQAKDWLKELIENNRYEYLNDDMIVYFETFMNKLWEE